MIKITPFLINDTIKLKIYWFVTIKNKGAKKNVTISRKTFSKE